MILSVAVRRQSAKVLCMQGRARPSLAKLYNWRYQALGDLPSVIQQERFRKANAGLAYDYQFIGEICNALVMYVCEYDIALMSWPVYHHMLW